MHKNYTALFWSYKKWLATSPQYQKVLNQF